MAVRPACVAGATAGPGARDDVDGRRLRLERPARHRGRVARSIGLDRRADHGRRSPTHRPSGRSASGAPFAVGPGSSAPGSTRRRSGSTPSSATARRSATTSSLRAGRATAIDSATRRSTSPTPSSEGDNALGVTVAEGWYRGRLGFRGGRREVYGTDIGPIAQLELLLRRRHDRHGGDRSPLARRSRTAPLGEPVRRRDVRRPAGRAGVVDAGLRRPRLGRRAASSPSVGPSAWRRPPDRRSAGSRRSGRCRSASSPSGATIVDFGQNISGRVRITVAAPAGDEVDAASRRGARARRARHPAAARRSGDRHLHPRRRAASRRTSRRSRSTGSATSRSTAGRAS